MASAPLTTWPDIRRAVAERCPVRPVIDGWNPMGVPTGLASWVDLVDALGVGAGPGDLDAAEAGAVLEEVARDTQLAEATGRWTLTRAPRREPSAYVPGDVLALRGLYASDVVLDPQADPWAATSTARVGVRYDGVPLARLLPAAEAYWLPAGAEEAVLSSEPPPPERLAELRHRRPATVVWLAHPAEISAAPPKDLLADLQADMDRFAITELQAPAALVSTVTMLDGLADGPASARLEGVVLFADHDGAVCDGVAWLVRVPPVFTGFADRGVVLGRRSLAGWRPVLEMMDAIVAWGDWTDPAILQVPARPDRDDLRRLRHGGTRRLEESGALAGVRVLDARRRQGPRSGDGPGTHASPIPHPRRGYWRSQLVGPRDQGRREPRWIPPTWVNADGPGRGPLRVYRLPLPPAEPSGLSPR